MRSRYVMMAMFLPGLLTSCQDPPVVYDVPGSQRYERDVAAVWPELVDTIKAKGLTIVEADQASGRLVADLIDYDDRGWAACRPARVIDRHDDKSRRDRGRPVNRQLRLDVQLDGTSGGSEVAMRADFSERQINPFKNLPFQVRCRSTGELERAVFEALDRV